MDPMTPAEIVIEVFGSRSEVARILEIVPSAVSRWTRDREGGGCGGDIPNMRYVRALLVEAKRRGLRLKEADLVHGKQVAVA